MRRNLLLGAALCISLALNTGVVTGALWARTSNPSANDSSDGHQAPSTAQAESATSSPVELVRSMNLTAEQRRALAERSAAHFKRTAPQRQQLLAARRALAAALKSDSEDAAAKLADVQAAQASLQGAAVEHIRQTRSLLRADQIDAYLQLTLGRLFGSATPQSLRAAAPPDFPSKANP